MHNLLNNSRNLFKKVWGSNLNLTVVHPQTDERDEHTIQNLEDILRACVLDFKGNWDNHLPPIDFVYNNNYHSSVKMAPYESLNERFFQSLIEWFEVDESGFMGLDLVYQTMEKGVMKFDILKKIILRYIGPFRLSNRIGNVAYELELANELAEIHQIFTVSMLNKCLAETSFIIPTENVCIKDNL